MLPEIERCIAELDGSDLVRSLAHSRLVTLGSDAVPPLINTMQAQTGRKAWEAAQILGELADPRGFQPLLELLHSRNPLLGEAAVKALLRYQEEDILPYLLDALPQAHIIVQQSMILVLERLADPRAADTLMSLLPALDSPTLRCVVIRTLASLGTMQAIPLITSYLDDENHHVREWAANALERLGAAPHVDAL
jgi:HEAT repeat protein